MFKKVIFSFRFFVIAGVMFSLLSQKGITKSESLTNDVLLKEISKGFSKVAKDATPAVVYIESQQGTTGDLNCGRKGRKLPKDSNPFDYFNDDFFNRFFGFPSPYERPSHQKEVVRGTGFIVSSNGYIVTNNHVVADSGKIIVTLNDGRKVPGKIVGLDAKTDLAVIKINENKLPFLTFGDSDSLEVGDWSIAIGNPFGLQATVTVGVISAKGRNQLHIADFEDFIQTDAAINPGNSGGPLLNIEGKVIGVNTAIVSGSGGYMGIGFAIPSSMANRIMDQLIKDGQVTRGFLGVTLQPIDTEIAEFYKLNNTKGALITDVVKDSPADRSGLKQEDIIVSYNGKEVESLSSFRNAISLMSPNSRLVLKINREGKILEIVVTITSSPANEKETLLEKIGVKVQNLSSETSKQFGFAYQKGALIVYVEPGSPADLVGIKAGNLILAVNRKKIANVSDLEQICKEIKKNNKILFMIAQGDLIRFVPLQLE